MATAAQAQSEILLYLMSSLRKKLCFLNHVHVGLYADCA